MANNSDRTITLGGVGRDGQPLRIVINPGSGPVKDATPALAAANMPQLLRDAGIPDAVWTPEPAHDYDNEYHDGRFAFVLTRDGRSAEVQMPGRPLDEVRYLDQKNQNIWDYPRLYVDDSSWVWLFAVRILRRELGDGEDDD